MRPQIAQDVNPRGGKDGYNRHRPVPALPIPFRSPAGSGESDEGRYAEGLERAQALLDDVLRQNLVLRAERDEARASLRTVLTHLHLAQSVVVAQAAGTPLASSAELKPARQCEAKLHCPTCPGVFVPVGMERVCMPCTRANRNRIATAANVRRREIKHAAAVHPNHRHAVARQQSNERARAAFQAPANATGEAHA